MAEQLAQAGYTLQSAFTIDQLLHYGLRTARITPQQYEQVTDYFKRKR